MKLRGALWFAFLSLIPVTSSMAAVSRSPLHLMRGTPPHLASATARGATIHTSAPDGAGGQYIAWADDRNGGGDGVFISTVYVQHLDLNGTADPAWPAAGLPVSLAPGDQDLPYIVSDATNGVIVVWQEYGSGWPNVFAQRISSNGTRLWNAQGVALSTGDGYRYLNSAISDGVGGVIAAFEDYGTDFSGTPHLRLQHVSSGGSIALGWTAQGIDLGSAPGGSAEPRLVPDVAGGALAFWTYDDGVQPKLLGQHVNAMGTKLWSPSDGQEFPGVVTAAVVSSDSAGGAYFVWSDIGPLFSLDIFAQRVNGLGVAQWTVGVCANNENQTNPGVACDPTGAAYIFWDDDRGGGWAQRLTTAGLPSWTADGVQVHDRAFSGSPFGILPDALGAYFNWLEFSPASGTYALRVQRLDNLGERSVDWPLSGILLNGPDPRMLFGVYGPLAAPDGFGGETLIWNDARMGEIDPLLFGQRVSPNGTVEWDQGGRALQSHTGCQRAPGLAPDELGGATVLWQDRRGSDWDIYSRGLSPEGVPQGLSGLVSTTFGDQFGVDVVTDGSGGAIGTWIDTRIGTHVLYANRVTSVGEPLWVPDGVALTNSGDQVFGQATCSDGAHGCVVAWSGFTGARLQRVDANGNSQWASGGVSPSANFDNGTFSPQALVPDGVGGVIFTWTRVVFDVNTQTTLQVLRTQRLNGAGSRLWGDDGYEITAQAGLGAFDVMPASDGAGGVYLTWGEGNPFDGTAVIRVIRIADGAVASGWPANGVIVRNVGGRKYPAAITATDDGVAVGWIDQRVAPWQSYCQKVSAGGTVMWTVDGVPVANSSGAQTLFGLVPSHGGKVLAAWIDGRSSSWDLYAQLLNDTDGAQLWGDPGVAVCTAPGTQHAASLASDGHGGALLAWQDERDLPLDLVMAARVDSTGVTIWTTDGVVATEASLVSAAFLDGAARLEWQVAPSAPVTIERTADGVEWQAVAARVADANGRVSFADAALEPGRTYGWRLVLHDGNRDARAAEAWLTIPGAAPLALAIARVSPNPTFARATIAFTLPGASRARLELLDVTGRRVRDLDPGPLGAGPHRLAIETQGLSPGVYVLRLTQAGSVATARVSVMR